MDTETMVSFKDVGVRFRVGGEVLEAVRGVSFDVKRGEVFGIVGTSGAGKSTLLRTINLLQRPTSGQVWVGDRDVSLLHGKALRELRLRVGMVFQHFNLIHTRTVHDNVALALRAAGANNEAIRRRVTELLELVELKDKEFTLPGQLSGGQKQRVGVARALANSPDLLLCDEPTSALDLETTESLLSLLSEINQRLGVTIIIISHEMNVIKRVCHRVAVMKTGRVVEQKGTYELFSEPEHPFSRDLVARSLDVALPERVTSKSSVLLVRLVYFGERAEEATISVTAQRHRVSLNILHGRIDYIRDKPIGVLIVGMDGDMDGVQSALSELRQSVARVEVLKHV